MRLRTREAELLGQLQIEESRWTEFVGRLEQMIKR